MKERKVADDITDAVFELLKTKSLANITTTEIIKKAGVCRSSFYRNFYLPEDVIRQYGIAMFEEIARKIPWPRAECTSIFWLSMSISGLSGNGSV